MKVFVEGIGLCAPGLNGWEASRSALAGRAEYAPAPTDIPVSNLLPANERRRTVPAVKLALAIGGEALGQAGWNADATATVFTSSSGDPETIHVILDALASSAREISPTRFHNSVHNAPSGYWSIANQSRDPSTSLCCHDASFVAGLIEAAAQATVDGRNVALLAYDLPHPPPLYGVRRIGTVFGVALALSPRPTARSMAGIEIELKPSNESATKVSDSQLEKLRTENPAARSLSLLCALAGDTSQTVIVDYLAGSRIFVSVAPSNRETPIRDATDAARIPALVGRGLG